VHPTDLRSGPCPHCGGKLEWKASVERLEQGLETHFFECNACGHIHTVEKKLIAKVRQMRRTDVARADQAGQARL